jgi:hypothetical protein
MTLDKAVKWYQETLGFTVINGTVEIVADDSSLGGPKSVIGCKP